MKFGRTYTLYGRPIIKLSPRQQQIYDLIVQRPRNAQQIIDQIWQLYPQDAPQRSCIKVHISQMNAKLCYRGQRIVTERHQPYRIIMVEPHAHPKRKPARNPNTAGLEGAQSTRTPRINR
jgi:hypothetical protein